MQMLTFGRFKCLCLEMVRLYVATELNNTPSLANTSPSRAKERWKPSTQELASVRVKVRAKMVFERQNCLSWQKYQGKNNCQDFLVFQNYLIWPILYPRGQIQNTTRTKKHHLFSSSSIKVFQILPIQPKASSAHWNNATLESSKWSPFILPKWITAKLFYVLWSFSKSPIHSLNIKVLKQKRRPTKSTELSQRLRQISRRDFILNYYFSTFKIHLPLPPWRELYLKEVHACIHSC